MLRTYLQDLDGELSTYNERELDLHYNCNLVTLLTESHMAIWGPYLVNVYKVRTIQVLSALVNKLDLSSFSYQAQFTKL